MVRATAKKQRIKRSCIQEVMRLRRMERRMERMKKRMRKEWKNKEEEEGHKSRNEKKEVLTPSASTQVLFHFCHPYQISHSFSVCEIYNNWNISHNSYS